MNQNEIKARSELSKFIEGYWSYQGTSDEDFILFPDGTIQVFFSESALKLNGQVCFAPGAYFVPVQKSPISIRTNGSLIGVRYKAFSFENIVDPRIDLKNRKFISLQTISANDSVIEDFLGKMSNEDQMEVLIGSIENVAYELISHNYHLNLNLRDKVNYILDRKGDIRVSDLCQEFGISRQGIHKFFKRHIGIPAKELASIWRLNYLLSLMSKKESLTTGILDAGFFDQAHGINSFKNTWGTSPKKFIETNQNLVDYEILRIDRRFSNYYDPEE